MTTNNRKKDAMDESLKDFYSNWIDKEIIKLGKDFKSMLKQVYEVGYDDGYIKKMEELQAKREKEKQQKSCQHIYIKYLAFKSKETIEICKKCNLLKS